MYRLYSFVNFYLSSIQQGVQTGHLTDNMSVKYLIMDVPKEKQKQEEKYVSWIVNHKTYIILNGGANENIVETYETLCNLCNELHLPFGSFHEDEASLSAIMTCCGVVVPEKFYNTMNYRAFVAKFPNESNRNRNVSHNEDAWYYVDELDRHMAYQPDTPEWKLISLIKSCGLAR